MDTSAVSAGRLRLVLVALALIGLAVAALFARGIASSSAKAGPGDVTVYSAAQKQVYINNQDDRERGVGANPFNSGNNAQTPQSSKLPAAGDQISSVSSLFKTANKKGKQGTATLTCDFNFNGNASCDTTIRLSGGTLVAEGAIHFNSKTFKLAIVGGTGTYRGASGELDVSPGGKGTQKFQIRLS